MNNVICKICGKPFHLKPSHILPNGNCCSKECSMKDRSNRMKGCGNHQYGLKGILNASFKGDKLIKKNHNLIDIRVYAPWHPHADRNGRVIEHRLIVEKNHKLFDEKYFEEINGIIVLKKSTQIHHINYNHNDNNINNLLPVTRSEHTTIHNMNMTIIRDDKTGRITGVIKQGELLENPEVDNQQPSTPLKKCEGSETNN